MGMRYDNGLNSLNLSLSLFRVPFLGGGLTSESFREAVRAFAPSPPQHFVPILAFKQFFI